jgi:hypothetical protein
MDWHGNPDSEILSETLQGHQHHYGTDFVGVYLQYIEMSRVIQILICMKFKIINLNNQTIVIDTVAQQAVRLLQFYRHYIKIRQQNNIKYSVKCMEIINSVMHFLIRKELMNHKQKTVEFYQLICYNAYASILNNALFYEREA